MARFTITVNEEDVGLVTFEYETSVPHFTVDDTDQIFEAIREAVSHLGIEP